MAEQVKALFEGSWKVYKSDNLENYLDAIDIGTIKKKAIGKLSPTMTVKVDGDTIDITTKVPIMTVKNTFKLGEDYNVQGGEMEARGNTILSGEKLITELTPTKDAKKAKQIVTREIVDGELVQTMTVGEVTAKRFFKKV